MTSRGCVACAGFLREGWYTGSSDIAHASFIACIAQKLGASAYVTQERVAGGLLCIVKRGLAIKRWRFLSAGKVRRPHGRPSHHPALLPPHQPVPSLLTLP